MPKKNYAAELIKKININNIDKKKIIGVDLQLSKEELIDFKNITKNINLLNEQRDKINTEIKKKVKEIKDIESIDISKLLSELNLRAPEKTTKKEIDELIRREVEKYKIQKIKNKEKLVEMEVRASILISLNFIYNNSRNPKKLLELYHRLIYQFQNIANLQFQNNLYQKNLFLNEAIKKLNWEIVNSKNVDQTLIDIQKRIKFN